MYFIITRVRKATNPNYVRIKRSYYLNPNSSAIIKLKYFFIKQFCRCANSRLYELFPILLYRIISQLREELANIRKDMEKVNNKNNRVRMTLVGTVHDKVQAWILRHTISEPRLVLPAMENIEPKHEKD